MGYMIIYDVIPSKDVKDLQKLWSNGGDWKNIFGTVEWGLFHILGDALRLKLDVFRTFRSVRCLQAGLQEGGPFPAGWHPVVTLVSPVPLCCDAYHDEAIRDSDTGEEILRL